MLLDIYSVIVGVQARFSKGERHMVGQDTDTMSTFQFGRS